MEWSHLKNKIIANVVFDSTKLELTPVFRGVDHVYRVVYHLIGNGDELMVSDVQTYSCIGMKN